MHLARTHPVRWNTHGMREGSFTLDAVPVCLEATMRVHHCEVVSQYMYTSWTYVVNAIAKYTFVTIPEQKMPATRPRKYLSNETNMSSSPHITADYDCMIVCCDSKSTRTLTLDLQVPRWFFDLEKRARTRKKERRTGLWYFGTYRDSCGSEDMSKLFF